MASINTALVPASLPPLYEVAGDLMALLDTEALVTPHQEAAFQDELESQLRTVAQKTDHVGGFIKMLEYAELNTRAEVARMEERARTLKRASERLREYTAAIIQRMGRKLEGDKFTLSVRACPASLEITKERAIPDKFFDLVPKLNRERLRKAIEAGEEVPGADLKLDGVSLVIR